MPSFVAVSLALAVGYVIGSFPSGLVVARLYRKVDIRNTGSGSTGATNTLRSVGVRAAGFVVLLDVLKGALAASVGLLTGSWFGDSTLAGAVAGASAIAGHCWPLYVRGAGGRGVATGFGVLAVLALPVAAISVTALVVVMLITRYVSVGSLAATLAAPASYTLLIATGNAQFDASLAGFIAVAATIVLLRHRGNIARLVEDREPRMDVN